MTTGDLLWQEIVLRTPEYENLSDEELTWALRAGNFPDSLIVEIIKARNARRV